MDNLSVSPLFFFLGEISQRREEDRFEKIFKSFLHFPSIRSLDEERDRGIEKGIEESLAKATRSFFLFLEEGKFNF